MYPIPQSAEIKAKEIIQQEKINSHNSFKVGPPNDNKYDELQELAARQSYSGHVFVSYFSRHSLLVNNDQHGSNGI